MGFPNPIRREALVLSARRCCVCRRYNGVGVEAHHIVPRASGGADTLRNAIVLCFDCHCAAGHYNDEHPRGTKFKPDELRRHRDEWYQRVKDAKLEAPNDDEFTEYYTRHLLCLDNSAAKELINQEKKDIPFPFQFVLDNTVRHFMQEILDDNLPHTWTSSDSDAGYYWGDHYDDLETLHQKHPEFNGHESRELTTEDFSDNGLVPSRAFKKIVDRGMEPRDLGNVRIQDVGCGGCVSIYVEMRRPLFVFAELKNTSSKPIKLSGIIIRCQETKNYVTSLNSWDEGELVAVSLNNLTLNPDESVIIPQCVLLSNIDSDDYSTDYVE